jgi:NAD(P)-dependent dehydrogenase (short-subunit alcohol dehydrogenase family)
MKVQGSVALVTGANRGIGEALVRELLAMQAAKVYAACRVPGDAAHLVAEGAGRVVAVQLDVTKEDQAKQAAKACPDVNLLINNAGLSQFGRRLINSPSIDEAMAEMDVNYFGVLRMCRAFAPVLKANGGGAIVNILSAAALSNLPVLGTYSPTKAAAYSLTQGVRAELAEQGTFVSAIFVGSVETRMAAEVKGVEKVTPEYTAKATLQSLERREEVVDADPMTIDIRARLARDPKKLERFLARSLKMVPPV